jgi:hypothetical protein
MEGRRMSRFRPKGSPPRQTSADLAQRERWALLSRLGTLRGMIRYPFGVAQGPSGLRTFRLSPERIAEARALLPAAERALREAGCDPEWPALKRRQWAEEGARDE